MTTQDVESVKKEIAEVSAFVKEKVEPLREERDRLQKSITDLVATERDIKRSQILSESAGEPATGNRYTRESCCQGVIRGG